MFSERLRNLWNSQNASRPIGPGVTPRDWFRFENKADASDLYIYDAIMDFGVTAGEFQRQLNEVKGRTLNLYINSPGGLVHEGVAIYNALKQHPAKVNVTVMGMAASIASVIAQAGDTIDMGLGSQMMIHNAQVAVQAFGMGDAEYLRAYRDELWADIGTAIDAATKMNTSIAGIYAARSRRPSSEWLTQMGTESWFTENEAVVAGLADTVAGKAIAKPTNQLEPTPDEGTVARRQLAAAYLEVIHAYAA